MNRTTFEPVETPAIVNIGLSERKEEITLEFAAEVTGSQIAIKDPITVPIVVRDVLIRVNTDHPRPLHVALFDVMRMLRMPMWMPPAWLRFPPRHLRHFYRVSDRDPGTISGFKREFTRYGEKVEGTDKQTPLYVYSDGSFILAEKKTDDGKTTLTWRIPRKPHWTMTDLKKMEDQGNMSLVQSCKVGDIECVLKKIRIRNGDESKLYVSSEIVASIVMSIFDNGPEVYDFWYSEEETAVYLLMKRVQGKTVYRRMGTRIMPELIEEFVKKSMPDARHGDTHVGNVFLEAKTNRIIPIDFGQFMTRDRAASRSFRSTDEDELLRVKRARLESLHDKYRRAHEPLPGSDFMDAEMLDE